jgi:hypothetical protein
MSDSSFARETRSAARRGWKKARLLNASRRVEAITTVLEHWKRFRLYLPRVTGGGCETA